MPAVEAFGRSEEGDVHRLTIADGGLSARIVDWGAVVQDLRLDGHRPPLVLGFETFDPYPSQSPFFGAMVGRFANRIAHGRFTLRGEQYRLDRNEGENTLHGGSKGFGRRLWEIADHGPSFVTLALLSPDGEMGFPGRLEARCTYRIEAPATLAIELEASCDAATICNIAHHGYFNLADGGAGSILDHELQIHADSYLPVDEASIPTGVEEDVAGSEFDFRSPRPIRRESDGSQVLYDHNFCLSRQRRPLRPVARARGPGQGPVLEMHTTEPGLQFYAGHKLKPGTRGLGGIVYGPRSGFCLEAQIWPDAPNRTGFPSAELVPGQTYRQRTEYRFSQA